MNKQLHRKIAQALMPCVLVAGIAGCKKADDPGAGYSCHITYTKIGASLAFVGFSVQDIDTLHVASYDQGTGVLLIRDTFVYNTANYNRVEPKADTINLSHYAARQPALQQGQDYEIYLPGSQSTFKITRLGYTPKPSSAAHSSPCKSTIRQSIAPDSGLVDGQLQYTGY